MTALPKRSRLVWADKVALVMALFIVGVAFYCWIIGIIGLDGRPHLRFDNAMLDVTLKAEFTLVPPIWLFLRSVDFCARALARGLRRLSLRLAGSGGLPGAVHPAPIAAVLV